MREFFKGWRRKVGCVALVMALTLMGTWIRSRHIHDFIFFPLLGRQHSIITALGRIHWIGMATVDGEWAFRPATELIHSPGEFDSNVAEARKLFGETEELRYRDLVISHWMLVLPLTLLSAYLLLWKPRPKEPRNA